MTPEDGAPDEGDGTEYVEAAEQIIQRAMNYMGRNRAIQIASSAPIEVDSGGHIESVQRDPEDRGFIESVLGAYVEVVGHQLVINIVKSAVSGPLAQELTAICRPDGGAGGPATEVGA